VKFSYRIKQVYRPTINVIHVHAVLLADLPKQIFLSLKSDGMKSILHKIRTFRKFNSAIHTFRGVAFFKNATNGKTAMRQINNLRGKNWTRGPRYTQNMIKLELVIINKKIFVSEFKGMLSVFLAGSYREIGRRLYDGEGDTKLNAEKR
jgi:hypothetical protein